MRPDVFDTVVIAGVCIGAGFWLGCLFITVVRNLYEHTATEAEIDRLRAKLVARNAAGARQPITDLGESK